MEGLIEQLRNSNRLRESRQQITKVSVKKEYNKHDKYNGNGIEPLTQKKALLHVICKSSLQDTETVGL